MWKRDASVILLVLLVAGAYTFWPGSANLDDLVNARPGYDVRILRDERGVPHVFGQTDADSPHYADQAPMFVQRQLKPVWLSEAEIRAHLEQEHRPGEELGQSP
jgi:acyl-homoserine lactone acylase PvdQ